MTDSSTPGVDDVDLTPAASAGVGKQYKKRSLRNWAILAVLGVVLSFVLVQALTSARVFFYNVDEATSLKAELADRTFRMQGMVETEPDAMADGSLHFTMAFNNVQAKVRHIGDAPSTLFECGTRVVIEGQWKQDQFESRLITVKHSEEYVEDNPDRIEYEGASEDAGSC